MCSEAFTEKNRYDQFWAQKQKNIINSHILRCYQYFSIIISLNNLYKNAQLAEYKKWTHLWYIRYQHCGPILGPKCILKKSTATDLRWSSLERASKNKRFCHIAKVCSMNSFRYIAKTNLDPCTFSCKTANTHKGFFEFAKKL